MGTVNTPNVTSRFRSPISLTLFAISAAIIIGLAGHANGAEAARHSRGKLAQISTRGVMDDDNALIAGFIITGFQPKKVIVRVLGPSTNLPNAVEDPYLAMYAIPEGREGYNDDWRDDQASEIVATTIPPGHPKESAVVATFISGSSGHTAVGYTEHHDAGLGLVEVYDLDLEADSELANISTRGLVESGDNILIAGFTVVGDEALRVMVRAIGPSIQKNLPHEKALTDPNLELRDRNGLLLASNDNWRSNQEAEIKATTIPPEADAEAALVHTLPQGPYTAILRSANGAVGLALVEVYALH